MFTVSTPCFLSFWDFRTSFFIEEAWFWGVRVGFGGREGALASALIYRDNIHRDRYMIGDIFGNEL